MAVFEIAFRRRVPIEGGFCADETDDGCWSGGKQGYGELTGTNWGITSPEYSKYIGHTASVAEMKAMPIEHAMDIFRKNYWNKFRGDEIDNQLISNDLYDDCVNCGLVTGIKHIQEAAGIKITGKMDDLTLNTLNNKI